MSESGLADSDEEFFVLMAALEDFKTGPLTYRVSDRALAKAAGVSPTTIGGWLRGKRFPQAIDSVLAVVGTVRAAAAASGVADPVRGTARLLDEGRWRTAYQAEARRRASLVSVGVQRA